jgi:hypothetical protein
MRIRISVPVLSHIWHTITYIPRRRKLTPLARGLRTEYDSRDLTPDEALLIAHFNCDQNYARWLIRDHPDKTAAQIVELYPHKPPIVKRWKRFISLLQRMEGTYSLGIAVNNIHAPEHRRKVEDDDDF